MRIYFLTTRQTVDAEHFLHRLNKLGPDETNMFIHNVIGISANVPYPFRVEDLVILYVSTEEDLDTMISYRETLAHSRIILILPNGDAETIHKGLLLKPRFIDYKDGDQKILMEVIRKIASQNDRNSAWDEVFYSARCN